MNLMTFARRLAVAGAAATVVSAGSAQAITVDGPDFTGVSYTEAPGAYTLINASADATVWRSPWSMPTASSAKPAMAVEGTSSA